MKQPSDRVLYLALIITGIIMLVALLLDRNGYIATAGFLIIGTAAGVPIGMRRRK